MKKIIFLLFLLIFFMVFSQDIVVQNDSVGKFSKVFYDTEGVSIPGNPYVDAGIDVVINCGQICTDINATFLEIGTTDIYSVSAIPFEPPISFSGLANSLNPDIDDSWSDVGNIPFVFCFFDAVESQFQIGSNGVIRFDVDPTDTGPDSNDWKFSQDIPNNTVEALRKANIFTPGHDLNPTTSNSEEIAWEIIGAAPNRMLAVSFYDVPMFGCDWLTVTHMAVLYETTNVIDIYIKNSPTCSANNASAVVGIQNNAGTEAFVPPGRNTTNSPWTAVDEAWRFTPSGSSIVDFSWLDEDGKILGTTPTLNVCPSKKTTYTARVVYTGCNGDKITVTDEVTVDVKSDDPPVIQLEDTYFLCEQTNGTETIDLPVLDTGLSDFNHSFSWYIGDLLLVTETDSQLTAPIPGDYRVTVTNTNTGCSSSDFTNVVVSGPPMIEAKITTPIFSKAQEIQVLVKGYGIYEYSLEGGPWQDNAIFSNVTSGAHSITARDINGCGFAITSIVVVDYPHYFTPNGDGYNDTWNIIGMKNDLPSKIFIYDRYGKLLKQINPAGLGWDGTFIGESMPTSDYWFVLKYNDLITGEQREYKGNFTLKR